MKKRLGMGVLWAATVCHAGPNLLIQGDTVYDRKTDLTWQRCSYGLRWNAADGNCIGVKKTFTFEEANSAAWPNSWRMPTKDELTTLVEEKGADGLFIDSKAFPDTGDAPVQLYWSSTLDDSANGWYVSFNDGLTTSLDGYRSFAYAVRLVRGGP